ncbi:MAG: Hint domain-containing protein [Jhaorihella sp.]
MRTGFRGTFVISWSQTDIDGLQAAPIESLEVGVAWSWHGEAVRVDGPNDILRLDLADEEADLRRRAAWTVRRLVGAAVQNRTDLDEIEVDDPLMDSSFVVTNGAQSFTVTVIEVGRGARPLLMFHDEMPPRGTDLWVVHHSLAALLPRREGADKAGVICFTPGTRIDTPEGPRRVEDLREGDRVETRDNGAQEILWIGNRRMTGARLFVMPALRPVRFRVGALGIDRPDEELLVSPDHRMLVRGPVTRALFNTPEVLVPARDLVNGSTITVDLDLREVSYVHLLLPSHQIIRANGIDTESFHPAGASLSALAGPDRDRLLTCLPDLDDDPHSYGGYARRNLTAPESAILMHEAA